MHYKAPYFLLFSAESSVESWYTGTGDGGLQSVLELVHLFLEAPCWEEAAMARAKQIWISNHRSQTKSLERSTADRVMEAMLGPDRSAAPCLRS